MTHAILPMGENTTSVIYAWSVNAGTILLKPNEDDTPAFSYLTKGILHEISEVNTPFQREQKVNLETWKAVCPLSHARLAKLQDQTYKLYLNINGLGGMMEEHQKEWARTLGITNSTNTQISKKVQDNLPDGTFTSVQVKTIAHNFPLINAYDTPTRVITLEVGLIVSIMNFFEAFFSGLSNTNTDDYTSVISQNSLADTILGSTEDAEDELRAAFVRNSTFTVYISKDLKYIEMEISQGNKTLMSYSGGKWVRSIFV